MFYADQENVDPLDEVAVANHYTEAGPTSHAHGNPLIPNFRAQNPGSVFGQEARPHNATASLLSNAERLDAFSEIPVIYEEDSTNRSNHVSFDVQEESARSHPSTMFGDVPAEQRLFSTANTREQRSSSHVNFDPVGNAARGDNQAVGRVQGRQLGGVNSAPSSLNGGMHFFFFYFT